MFQNRIGSNVTLERICDLRTPKATFQILWQLGKPYSWLNEQIVCTGNLVMYYELLQFHIF